MSNLGNDEREIEKARDDVFKGKERKEEISIKIEQLKNEIKQLKNELSRIQSMASEQLKNTLVSKLQLTGLFGSLVDDYNKEVMMQARPFLQKIQENPQLIEEYYSDYSVYTGASQEEIVKNDDNFNIRVSSSVSYLGEARVYVKVDGGEFFDYNTFYSELLSYEEKLKNLERAQEMRREKNVKLRPLYNLNFSDYDSVLNVLKKFSAGKETYDIIDIGVRLYELKKLNKKVFKTKSVKEDIEYHEEEVKKFIFFTLKKILSEMGLNDYYSYNGFGGIFVNVEYLKSTSSFAELVTYIQKYFDSFEKDIREHDKEIDDLKVKIAKYKKADSMVKEIDEERAKHKDEIRARIKEKYGIDMDLIRNFLGENRRKEGATYTEPTSTYLSEIDTLTEIDDGLKQQKEGITIEELERLKSVVKNYGNDVPEESTGPKTI